MPPTGRRQAEKGGTFAVGLEVEEGPGEDSGGSGSPPAPGSSPVCFSSSACPAGPAHLMLRTLPPLEGLLRTGPERSPQPPLCLVPPRQGAATPLRSTLGRRMPGSDSQGLMVGFSLHTVNSFWLAWVEAGGPGGPWLCAFVLRGFKTVSVCGSLSDVCGCFPA